MSEVVLEAERRKVIGKQVKQLRAEGKLPAVIYGSGIEPTAITLNYLDTTRILRGVSASTLVTIKLEDEEHTTLLRERQFDRIKRQMIHIDFLAVAMNVTLRTSVPIRLIGEAPAVEDYSAMIFAETESLEVEALPGDLPESIEVDISVLKTLGDNITLADLDLGPNVLILDNLDTVIATAIAGVSEEEEEEEEDVIEEGAEPEVIERGKREEDEEEE
ncbi:MAG TPA: 50S ribosomal protein L25 [Anaerolineales bacterium]|nr:50S ribosomal protein L25 [Anaerolineales bacterium]